MNETHIFDPKHIETLESEERKTWQKREEIIQLLKLKPSYIVADLGCGSGYFTVPISYMVKKIFGIDIQKEMLEFLDQKIQKQNITNIETLLSKKNIIPLRNEMVDLLLSVNTLHEFNDKKRIIEEIRRVIKSKGKLAIVDFKKEDTGFGPPMSIRLSKEQASHLIEKQGFTILKSQDIKYQYIIFFEKIGN